MIESDVMRLLDRVEAEEEEEEEAESQFYRIRKRSRTRKLGTRVEDSFSFFLTFSILISLFSPHKIY